MIRRSLTAAIAAIAVTTAPMAAADEGDFIHSPKGRTFRVRFDPESRIRLAAAATPKGRYM